MITIKNKQNCCGCEACVNICPVHCISMEYDEEGFRYPKVDLTKCINCHLCEKICPIANFYCSSNKGYLVYGATNKDKKILKESTSGGVFFELGKLIIEKYQGVVFGVKFDATNYAFYDQAETIEQLKEFMGSKYIQAKVNDAYKQVRNLLEKKRVVLFSGTPCQIAGLNSYLGKKYSNLYTLDLVCEGVPSEILLNVFKNHYEKKYHLKIKDIKFRNKKYGWKYSSFLITFENGKTLYLPRTEVSFLKMLYGFIDMRPSCYNCKFRELNSGSDFKLADFWEVQNSKQGTYQFYGVSHLLINNQKAEKLFFNIKDKFLLTPSSIEEVKKLNNSFNTQVFSDQKKKDFNAKIKGKNQEEIFRIMNSYLDINILEKIKFRIKLRLVKIKYMFKKGKRKG